LRFGACTHLNIQNPFFKDKDVQVDANKSGKEEEEGDEEGGESDVDSLTVEGDL